MLCQENVELNWHSIAYYSRKVQLAKRNQETNNAKLLAIVEKFKT